MGKGVSFGGKVGDENPCDTVRFTPFEASSDNACKEHRYLPVFSKRTRLRKSIYRTVADRWNELGLPGTVPNVLSFEPEPGENRGGSRYHDEKALRSAGDMMPAAKPTKRPAEKRARPRKK